MPAPTPLFRNDLVRDGDQTGRVVDRHPELVRVDWGRGEPTWHWAADMQRVEEIIRRAAA